MIGAAARGREPVPGMRRREFIAGLGGVVAMPSDNARAQAIPVIGILHSQSPDGFESRLRAFRQGLKEVGFVEGENVTIEYAWAENQVDRLPVLAAGLARRQVAAIVAFAPAATLAAKGQPRRSLLCSGSPTIRSGLALSPASRGRAATSLASIFSSC
jgi:putative ABC transport system substrate-binding protein